MTSDFQQQTQIASQPTQLAACESLIREHREVEELLIELESNIHDLCDNQQTTSLQKAKHILEQLTAEMNTHFSCEEHGLFPILSKYHPMVLMEVEHDEILDLRKRLSVALNQYEMKEGCNKNLTSLAGAFLEDLRNHMAREDAGIFPTAERALSTDEKQEVIEAMDKIRADAKQAPTLEIHRSIPEYKTFGLDLTREFSKPISTEELLSHHELQIKALEIQAGTDLKQHWSPNRIILVLLFGEAEWYTSDVPVKLKTGEGVVMDPRLNHALRATTDCRFLMILDPPSSS